MTDGIDEDRMDIADNDESSDDEDDESEDEGSSNIREEEEDEQGERIGPSKVYLPGQPLQQGEELIVDRSAYRMLHQAQSGAPCLSFDVIRDDLGNARDTYPLTMYLVAGTQAPKPHINNLLVMKMSNLHCIKDDADDSDNDYSGSDDDNRPMMSVVPLKHQGCVNRVRCTQIQHTTLAASWSELGRVNIWDLNEPLQIAERSGKKPDCNTKPLYTFKGHLSEGYGIDWCPTEAGTLATGDCKGNIHIWRIGNVSDSASWHVDQRPYNSHAPHSVEDLQWSPNERHVLASCSVDKSIKIWDTRESPQSACMLTASGAHTADINVISWNRTESQFLLSGGDDGLLSVWDLREFNANGASPVATFKQHTAPVTTVEWHPQEATVFASGGADNQIAQWDLSVEVDHSEEAQDSDLANLPPQLLFIHQGQTDIKELHWHSQCTGVLVSTAHSGFNIFRTISV